MRRSKDAFEAFHRALSSSDAAARHDLCQQELARLATLEERIRTRDAAEPEKMQHRLDALEGMRTAVARAQVA